MSKQPSENSSGSENQAAQDVAHNAGVGPLLRASRQRVGEDLGDVAAMLRIRFPYLEAIEEGRFADLPGQTYAVGFVRTYAEHLGLDGEEVVRRFKSELAVGNARANLHFPTPMVETSVPGGAIVFVGLVAAALAYGAWYLSTTEERFFSDLVEPLPARLAALVSDKEKLAEPATKEAKEDAPAPVMTTVEQKPESSPEPVKTEAQQTAEKPVQTEETREPGIRLDPAPKRVTAEQSGTMAPTPASETASSAASEPTASSAAPEPTTSSAASESTASSAASETAVSSAASEPTAPAQQQPAMSPPPPPPPPSAAAASETSISTPAETRTEITAQSEPETIVANTETEQPTREAEAAVAEQAVQIAEPASRITVRASANSWIEVRDDFSNTNLVSRLLREGDSYEVPNKIGLSLHTGNAGALEILVDGALVPTIGEAGAVQRGVELDPDALKAGTAAQ